MTEQTMTLSEAAGILAVNVETLRRAIKAGRLKAARFGRRYRVSRFDLADYYKRLGGGELWAGEEEALQ